MSEESDMKGEKTDQGLVSLIHFLKKYSHEEEAPIWRDIAKRLERPRRSWATVNVSRLDLYAEPKDFIVVPGSLLGAGLLDKPLTVAAYKISKGAEEKIIEAGGKTLTIDQLASERPKGQGVRIMG